MGELEAAVAGELQGFPPAMRKSAIAVSALAIARELDDPLAEISTRDRTAYYRELRIAMVTLRDQAPGNADGDETDMKRKAREDRLKLVVSE